MKKFPKQIHAALNAFSLKRSAFSPKQIHSILTILVLTIIPFTATIAQDGFEDSVTDVPIDGGLSLLVAAGVGYGIKKVREGRKKKGVEIDG